jgi:predicted CXXCH cytochrome family protein
MGTYNAPLAMIPMDHGRRRIPSGERKASIKYVRFVMNISNGWKSSIIIFGTVLGLILVLPVITPCHTDSNLLPEGCGSCHVGHGMSGQPMLEMAEEEFCYQCHGSAAERSKMIASGRLSASAVLSDIEAEFQKTYRHPVVDGMGHSPSEELPRLGEGEVRHAECGDCHNPHDKVRSGKSAIRKVKGYSLIGQYLETSSREYEICLKCHSNRMAFNQKERSLVDDFSINARSQHPVTKPGRGIQLPSLIATLGLGGTMLCSDCHRSGDPDSARGPHGSMHQHLLSGNYDTGVYAEESALSFEFCYSCHDRSSILSNESFTLHREHLVGDPIVGRTGTSCYSCHVSHGSKSNPHLLEFNSLAVQPEERLGIVEYRALGAGSGECYLKCHDHNHSPGRY